MPLVKTSLHYFDEAVRQGSIRKAADSLHVASSAVNRQLLHLEDEMGVQLFERLPRGIRPTAAGEVLLSYVRRWNKETTALHREVGSLRGGIRGTIRIAASETFTEELIPSAMAELQIQFPQVDFTLISGDNHRITSELFAKDADVVLAFDVNDNVRAHIVHQLTSPLGVICVPDHPLARLAKATLNDCTPFPLVVPGRDWLLHSGLSVLVQDHQAPGHVVARAERPGMLKALVRAGIGIAFLTALGVQRDVAEGRLRWIPLAPGIIKPATISLMVPRGRVAPGYTRAFVEILQSRLEREMAK